MTLNESDFTSLEQFPLRWRFTDPRRSAIPPEALKRIRPLTASRANECAAAARVRGSEERTFGVTFRSDDRPDDVRSRLRGLPPAPGEEILVSWNSNTAVTSTWDVFVAYWDDFCYPSSDDVTVWPVDEGWTLCYRHYEIFQFTSGLRAA
jgi:hypothetical protein